MARRRSKSRRGRHLLLALLVAGAAMALGAWLAVLQESGWRLPGLHLPFGDNGEAFDRGDRRALERVLHEGGEALGK